MEIVSMPSPDGALATEMAATKSIMGQLGPGLAALMPAFNIIDALLALFGVVEKAPEIPVDPTGFVLALDDARKKFEKLGLLVPALAVPSTVASTITAVARFGRAIIAQLEEVATATAAAQALLDQALSAGDTALQTEAQCALDNAATLGQHAASSMGPMKSVLDAVTLLIGLIGGGVNIPDLPPDPASMSAQALIDALEPIVEVLEQIKVPGT
jgi:hypothetical protein